ncbi:MAG: hypothetical protein DLM60_04060 [Pseudonocardiales bacterium]|nr:hypothetical protein [Actinomycetota bacterium]PZS22607.1 MAG: hypothetical protein DLM60_04060 [Pseudonocardiales bacterium]
MIRHQWLLIVAIAAGLVGMHHLVADPAGHTMPMMVATDSGSTSIPTERSHAGPVGVNPVVPRLVSISVVVSQADCCVGHCCVAVLTALTGLATALILVAAWRRPSEPGFLLAVVGALGARGPPTGCARFTQLCVLRR